jgi:hypothetical protein
VRNQDGISSFQRERLEARIDLLFARGSKDAQLLSDTAGRFLNILDIGLATRRRPR